ncbi:MAG: hypothetical protein WCC39_19000 [Telluria sp.]
MQTLLRAHWKVHVAIVLLVLLALFAVAPGAAVPAPPLPSLASRLHAHAAAIGSGGAARHVRHVLAAEGYAVRRHGASIEASVANLAPNARPARIFIVGVNGDGDGSGTAAVLELARLLKDLRPSLGTEVKFVFFMGKDARDAPQAGSFIAFAGGVASARLVQDALSAFRAVSRMPARGLAAPAYVEGVTLSSHAGCQGGCYPAIAYTDTGFLRYPYYRMTTDDTTETTGSEATRDVEETARVVQGLARTITALAAGAQG